MEQRFNVRVYGILIDQGRVLVNEELIKGQRIIKFPGGGLQWGEGTIECLKREWQEELRIDITVTDHFYTTDYFQPSAFDMSQVISIYYKVHGNIPDPIVNHVPNERTYWMELTSVGEETFSLPIDKKVGSLLKVLYGD